jgi:polyferredoxin
MSSRKSALRPWRAIALLLAGLVALLLSLYAAFFAFGSFYLGTDSLGESLTRIWMVRLAWTAVGVLVAIALFWCAYLCFAKCHELRRPPQTLQHGKS